MAYDFTNGPYFNLDTSPQPVSNGDFTYHCWANPDSVNLNDALMGVFEVSDYISLQIMGGGGDVIRAVAFDSGVATYTLSTTDTFSQDIWQTMGLVSTGASSRYVYYNGNASAENTTTVTPEVDSGTFQLGESSGASPLDGQLAEVAVWAAALTAAEMLALAAGYSALLIRPASLVYYAPLRNNTNDLVGGITLTAVGGTPTPVADHPRIIQPSAQILQFPSGAAPPVGVPFIGEGQAGAYDWAGAIGILSAGFIDAGLHTPYDWAGSIGVLNTGFEDEGQHSTYDWTGFIGVLTAGTIVPFIGEGQAGAYEWAGELGSEQLGFHVQSGPNAVYEWTGGFGSVDLGGGGFNEAGQTGFYEWAGQDGVLQKGYRVQSGPNAVYHWTGFVGSLQVGEGFTGEGQAGQYEWQGFIGAFIFGIAQDLEGQAGQYEWASQPGEEIRGYNPLIPAAFTTYVWTGYRGLDFIGRPQPKGNQVNDCMFSVLSETFGFTGSLNEMLVQFYQNFGATSNDIDTAEYEFLIAQGAAPTQVNDMWVEFLVNRGHPADINDGKFSFWCINGGAP